MPTVKLYQQDVTLRETCAEVREIRQSENGAVLILDKTIFFPTGGGQPCDMGSIGAAVGSSFFDVIDVYEAQDEICHVIKTEACPFCAGDKVLCRLDWKRRFDHMQRHCGEHILSGIFFREFGGVNRGFHMGEEYMTIDIHLEEDPEISEITWEMALRAERCANEAIWANLPVITRTFESKEDAEKLPLRKALTFSENIIVVCVGNPESPADCVACCGTHPKTSGQVGLIKLYKLESYKGMTRVYFEAGARAMQDYGLKHDVLTTICSKYSANAGDLLDKMSAQEEKIKALKNELYVFRHTLIKEKVQEVETGLASCSEKILVKEFEGLKTDDLLHVGRPFEGKTDKLLLIISPQENTLLLFSDGKRFDCGKLVRDNVGIYNGKGGGSPQSARALFPNREYLETYIDLIEKHLR